MPRSYSDDLRQRVIETVTSGASRRAAAEVFEVAASTAVKWMQRWCETAVRRRNRAGGALLGWRSMRP